MRKVFLLLQRVVLAAGILVALTPCALCPKVGAAKAASVSPCSMGHMNSKAGCCHKAKSSSPFCKMMDQSSASAVSVHADVAVVPAGSTAVLGTPVLTAAQTCSAVPSVHSPPRSPSVLRI